MGKHYVYKVSWMFFSAQNATHATPLNLYQNMVQMQSARSQNPARCQGLKKTRQNSTQNHFFANAISQKIAYRKPYKHLINTMIFHAFLLRFRDCAQNVTHAKRLNLYQNMVQMQSARSQNPGVPGLQEKQLVVDSKSHFGDCNST